MRWPGFFYPHQISVRDLTDEGGLGSSWGSPRTLDAEVKDEQKLVRNAEGSEVVSSTQVKVPLDSDVAPGALVKVWAGTTAEREARVITVGRSDNRGTPLDSYLTLSLE